jgi:hypothetical protein
MSLATGPGYAGHGVSAPIKFIGLLALLTYAALGRTRMTELEFLAVLVIDQAFAAVLIHLVEGD